MSKKTKRLEKENLNLTRKHDQTNRNILEMAEERTRDKDELEKMHKQEAQMRSIIQSMREQGRALPQGSEPELDEEGTESDYDDEYEDEEDEEEEEEASYDEEEFLAATAAEADTTDASPTATTTPPGKTSVLDIDSGGNGVDTLPHQQQQPTLNGTPKPTLANGVGVKEG